MADIHDWIVAVASVVSVGVALTVLKWAKQQAEAQKKAADAATDALEETRVDRRAALQPILIPQGPPKLDAVGEHWAMEGARRSEILQLENHGPGPAVNVTVRLWIAEEGTLYQGWLEIVPSQATEVYVVSSRSGSIPRHPVKHLGDLFEVIYQDVFGQQHRTLARWENGGWVEIRFDTQGNPGIGRAFEGTEYLQSPLAADVQREG